MSKLTYVFVMSMLILWLAGSGCVGNNTDSQDAGLAQNTSAGQELTEADVHEFDKNITDLEDLLENSSEEIVVEEL